MACTCCYTFIITATRGCQVGGIFLDWGKKIGTYQKLINTKATLTLAVFSCFPYTYTNEVYFLSSSSFSRQGHWCLSSPCEDLAKIPAQERTVEGQCLVSRGWRVFFNRTPFGPATATSLSQTARSGNEPWCKGSVNAPPPAVMHGQSLHIPWNILPQGFIGKWRTRAANLSKICTGKLD